MCAPYSLFLFQTPLCRSRSDAAKSLSCFGSKAGLLILPASILNQILLELSIILAFNAHNLGFLDLRMFVNH